MRNLAFYFQMAESHVCTIEEGLLYHCGNCSYIFPTICQLQKHLTHHDSGGSFYFDNILKIATVKNGSVCRGTQTWEVDKPMQRRGRSQYKQHTNLSTDASIKKSKHRTTAKPKESLSALRKSQRKQKKRKVVRSSERVRADQVIEQSENSFKTKVPIHIDSLSLSYSSDELTECNEPLNSDLNEHLSLVINENLGESLVIRSHRNKKDTKFPIYEMKKRSGSTTGFTYEVLHEKQKLSNTDTLIADAKHRIVKANSTWFPGCNSLEQQPETGDDVKNIDKNMKLVSNGCPPSIVSVEGGQPIDTNSVEGVQPIDTNSVEGVQPIDTNSVEGVQPIDTNSMEVAQPIDTNKNNKRVMCEVCGKDMLRCNYQDHLNIHKGKTPYICEVCGRQYSAKKALNLHKICKHTQENKLIQCRYCTKKFAIRGHLLKHQKMHLKEKTFHCNECGNPFASQETLNRHVKYIHGNVSKSHECHLCDKKFKFRKNLLEHTSSHTTKYPCSVCGNSFNRHASLKRHIRIHSGEKPHKCHICGHEFIQKTPYWVHMEKHHDLTKSEVQVMQQEQRAIDQHNKPLEAPFITQSA